MTDQVIPLAERTRMAAFVARRLRTLQYAVRQTQKIGWFGAHYALTQRRAVPGNPSKLAREKETDVIGPTEDIGWDILGRGILNLLRKDARAIRTGTYLPPARENITLSRAIRDSIRYFRGRWPKSTVGVRQTPTPKF